MRLQGSTDRTGWLVLALVVVVVVILAYLLLFTNVL